MNDQDHDMRPDLAALLPTARRQHTFQVVPPAQQLAWLWQNSFSPLILPGADIHVRGLLCGICRSRAAAAYLSVGTGFPERQMSVTVPSLQS